MLDDSSSTRREPRSALLGAAPPSRNFALWPFRDKNHNVVVTWIEVVLQGSADSIWTNTVLASFVYELMKTTSTPNAYAGYVEAAQGIANLVVALPVGYAADKLSKARIVALGGVLMPPRPPPWLPPSDVRDVEVEGGTS